MISILAQDFHGQYIDKKLFRLLLKFIKRIKPDQIVLPGDIVDFYSISKFNKNPARKWDLQWELDVTHNLLVDVRNSAPNAKIVYIEGNHEARLRTYLWSKAKALATLDSLKIEKLLGLEGLDIEYRDKFWDGGTRKEKGGLLIGDLFCYHGSVIRQGAGATARAELTKNGCSGISGHSHRDGKAPTNKRDGQKCWWENFCMCQLDAEYIDGVSDWTQGWSVVTVKGGKPSVEQVHVVDYKYIYRGEVYK